MCVLMPPWTVLRQAQALIFMVGSTLMAFFLSVDRGSDGYNNRGNAELSETNPSPFFSLILSCASPPISYILYPHPMFAPIIVYPYTCRI